MFGLLTLNTFGQTRTITGKVISEDLQVLPQVKILNSDTALLATTDIDGKFKIEIPADTKNLLIGAVGYEWASINLTNNCNKLDIILMNNGHYDYISLKKVDRLRMKRFKKLSELHLTAYQKGMFVTDEPCYEQTFMPLSKK
jgi:hypothetical protein